MKKVAIDLIAAGTGFKGAKNHGGGEYCKTVFDYCYHKSTGQFHVIIADNDDLNDFLKPYDKLIIHRCKDSKDYNDLLNKELFDVVFSGLLDGQYDDVKFPNQTKLIFTEHGLRGIEVRFDKIFVKTEKKKFKNRVKMIMSKVMPKRYLKTKIGIYKGEFEIAKNYELVTVSEHSKYAIMNYFPYVKNVFVGYSPMKIVNGNTDDSILNKYSLEKGKYILMVSASRGEKNCLRGMMAIDKLKKENALPKDIKVVMTGVTYEKPFKKYVDNNVIVLGYVDTITLETLYKNAHLFLYPTVNEGFGYPPLEAMKYHTLVATSAITSVPEVCGDAVIYFNPYDINEIKNRIMQSFDEKIRQYHISKIDDRLAYISQKQQEGLERLYLKIFGDANE